jgi:putative ABC transport system substrate-binding protein
MSMSCSNGQALLLRRQTTRLEKILWRDDPLLGPLKDRCQIERRRRYADPHRSRSRGRCATSVGLAEIIARQMTRRRVGGVVSFIRLGALARNGPMPVTIKRREFVAAIGGAIAAWPFAARAQQGERTRHIGILMPYAEGDAVNEARVLAFKQELEKLGWMAGRDVQFDEHWTTDNMDQVRSHAASLMASNPDVVIATGGRVVPVLMRLTSSIPIVLPGGSDPVRAGYAKSLARPGGNVTGFTLLELPMLGKTLEILKQIAPAVIRTLLIYNPDNPNSVLYSQASKTASSPLGIEPVDVPIHGFADIEHAITNLADSSDSGIFFLPDISTLGLRQEVVNLAARRRVPAIYWDSSFVKTGGLASYAADRIDIFRRAAGYVDRILRGEKAADLPFQQPTKYELVINAKTAKALGLVVPPLLLATADEVIE